MIKIIFYGQKVPPWVQKTNRDDIKIICKGLLICWRYKGVTQMMGYKKLCLSKHVDSIEIIGAPTNIICIRNLIRYYCWNKYFHKPKPNSDTN